MNEQTEQIRKRYNRVARFFDLTESFMENDNMRNWRALVWKEASGKVLEIGVGTGKNIEHYPENSKVTAIDFSENMIERAQKRAIRLGKKVDLRLMDVQALQFPSETFDTIITTCVFCSVPDPIKGLQEIKRVCKKDGKIIMLEHVRSQRPFTGKVMDLLNPLVVRMIGANINRNTVSNLIKAGIKVEIENDLLLDIVKYIKCTKNID